VHQLDIKVLNANYIHRFLKEIFSD